MSLDRQLEQYWPQLGSDEKKSILGVMKSILKLKDHTPQTARVTIEEYNKEAHDAMARVANGQFYTREEVEEMSKEW